MINTKPNNTTEIIKAVLVLLEEGKNSSDILNAYPEYKNTIQEIIQTINILKNEKEKNLPPKEILSKIISAIIAQEKNTVTKQEFNRYLIRDEKILNFSTFKGRSSLIMNRIRSQYTMTKQWKIIIPVGIIAIIAILGITIKQSEQQLQKKIANMPTQKQEIITYPTSQTPIAKSPMPTPAKKTESLTTNDIDVTINTIFNDFAEEISQINQTTDDDATLVFLDAQVISDLGQSYNENEF
jgi:hypothetical protein